MNPNPDGGDAILHAFRALSIDCIFSSPGSEWSSVWEAMAREKVADAGFVDNIAPAYHSCWHETLAADMALGYTLATGRMQAVMLHAGVGLLQGAVGVHAAHIQNVPMLVLSGEALTYGERPGFDPGRQWYQNLSVVGGPQRLVEPYVKWAGQAGSIDTLYETVVRAGRMAQRAPMGPTYVNVPIETMMQPWRRPARLDKDPVALPPRAPVPEIERIAQLLARSKNPVITTEAGGRSPESHAALHALAETLAIPVIETASSLFSNFPKDHPLHQGSNFEPFLETTDLALVVRSRIPWYPPSQRPPNGQVVLIDENPYRHHMVYQSLHADAVLEGDVAFTLETLRAAAQAAGLDAATIAGRRARHAAAHAKLDEARHATLGKAKSRRPIAPEWLCAALSEALPADTVYVDETVSNRGAVETHLRNQGQGSFLQVRGALGQCLGHALGAKLALRGRTVAALVGDGSFLYNPVTQSLGYAAQASLPILIVVFNNNEYRAMRETHLDYYPEGVAKKHNLFYGGPLGGPDYAALGAPFGAWGRKVEDPAALVPAIREALAATLEGRTAILNVVLEK